jgi:hypothetical protein
VEAAEHALADARVQLDQAIDDYENRRLVVPFDHATVAAKASNRGAQAAHEVAFPPDRYLHGPREPRRAGHHDRFARIRTSSAGASHSAGNSS